MNNNSNILSEAGNTVWLNWPAFKTFFSRPGTLFYPELSEQRELMSKLTLTDLEILKNRKLQSYNINTPSLFHCIMMAKRCHDDRIIFHLQSHNLAVRFMDKRSRHDMRKSSMNLIAKLRRITSAPKHARNNQTSLHTSPTTSTPTASTNVNNFNSSTGSSASNDEGAQSPISISHQDMAFLSDFVPQMDQSEALLFGFPRFENFQNNFG